MWNLSVIMTDMDFGTVPGRRHVYVNPLAAQQQWLSAWVKDCKR